ncbi:polysaccharide biosynthesis/export family protein [uncultured Sunxiuqinia sp.]|uniref:polysaccharide biosynthesis/export family protein n=1 Tax=uncultured Sunxiuqinia sp. TaxID=1573825 RepID=UPI002AA6B65B|nr:polysaccharide biosynthesis/export family protein [uncultured Sunxiuqinia sp.]
MKMIKLKLLLFLFISVGFGSCRSNKDLTYFQNLSSENFRTQAIFSIENYKLQESDNLYIKVVSVDPNVSQLFNSSSGSGSFGGTSQQYGSEVTQHLNGYQVDKLGFVELPIVGKLFVLNKTLLDARELIYHEIKKYFKEVTVYVKLMSFEYTVMGEVSKPGVYSCFKNTRTILEAISQASGTTDYAKLKNVIVLRGSGEEKQSIRIDFTDRSFLNSEAYYLQPDDVVYVCPDKYKNARLNSSTYSLLLTSITTLIVFLKYIN